MKENNLEKLIGQWHRDRNLIDGSTDKDQFMKLLQEVGELSDSLCKGKDFRDDVGDIMVVDAATKTTAVSGTDETAHYVRFVPKEDWKGYFNFQIQIQDIRLLQLLNQIKLAFNKSFQEKLGQIFVLVFHQLLHWQ